MIEIMIEIQANMSRLTAGPISFHLGDLEGPTLIELIPAGANSHNHDLTLGNDYLY